MSQNTESDDMKIVDRLFASGGYTLLPFTKGERRDPKNPGEQIKTPDRKVVRDGEVVAFLELKSLQKDPWWEEREQLWNKRCEEAEKRFFSISIAELKEEMARAPRTTTVEVRESDPTFNRLSDHIKKASQQFDAVNPDRVIPDILVFVSHDVMTRRIDLEQVLTGSFPTAYGTRTQTAAIRISEGIRIRELKTHIDSYLWFDIEEDRWEAMFADNESKHWEAIVRILESFRTTILQAEHDREARKRG